MKDLRSFLADLEREDDLVHVKQEVDWDLEMGAIVRRVCENGSPAPLFEKVKDYPGFMVTGATVATYRRLAIALGVSPNLSIPELANVYTELTHRPPIQPVLVDDGPCKENKFLADDVDLFSLPIPMVHGGDGGRYIGTWHIIITKDPDTGLVNWGMYRTMAFNHNMMTGLILPFSDTGKVLYRKFEPHNRPMPFAMCIGNHPFVPFVGSAPIPLPEPEALGGMMGEPARLVKCETCDLEVPADTEIVVEGEILPNARLHEGPFGEYVGYNSARELRNVYRVNAITHRNNAIMTMSNMGMPTDEGQLLRSFTMAIEMKRLLDREGIPVTGIHMYPESAHHLLVVAVKPLYANIANQIANLLFGSKNSPFFFYIFVVEDDVDVYNWKEVMHAFATKCNPARNIMILEHSQGNPIIPFLELEERAKGVAGKVCFDCTTPIDWPKETTRPLKVSFANPDTYPTGIQEKVLANWQKYGYKD